MDLEKLRAVVTQFIYNQPRVLLGIIGLCVLYVFTVFFPLLHSICMFGGLINILVFVRMRGGTQDLETSLQNQLDVMLDAVVYGATGYCISLVLIPYFLLHQNHRSQDLYSWIMHPGKKAEPAESIS